MNKPTTNKQRKFIRELIRTFEPTEAAMRSYNCKDRKTARVIASQNLTKLNIQMSELMDTMGLNTEKDIEDLKRLREATITKHFTFQGRIVDEAEYEDNGTRLKALELTCKLKGLIKDNNIDINNNTNISNITLTIKGNKDIDSQNKTDDRNVNLHTRQSTRCFTQKK